MAKGKKVYKPKEDEKSRQTKALETRRVVSQFPCFPQDCRPGIGIRGLCQPYHTTEGFELGFAGESRQRDV